MKKLKTRLNGFRFLNRMLASGCFSVNVFLREMKRVKYRLSLTLECLTFKPSPHLDLTKIHTMKTKIHAYDILRTVTDASMWIKPAGYAQGQDNQQSKESVLR